jgi:hypothetical protein
MDAERRVSRVADFEPRVATFRPSAATFEVDPSVRTSGANL